MNLHDAVAKLTAECHHANAKWWVDPETGEDVRNWPTKFFKLWVATKIGLIMSEAAEALEGHRKDAMDDHLPHRKAIEVELADALIRIGDLAGGFGLDLAGAVIEKMAYNAKRADHKLANRVQDGGKSF